MKFPFSNDYSVSQVDIKLTTTMAIRVKETCLLFDRASGGLGDVQPITEKLGQWGGEEKNIFLMLYLY